jgi:hypothetical protein
MLPSGSIESPGMSRYKDATCSWTNPGGEKVPPDKVKMSGVSELSDWTLAQGVTTAVSLRYLAASSGFPPAIVVLLLPMMAALLFSMRSVFPKCPFRVSFAKASDN